VGDPRLRSGREVSLSGVSPRMTGTYRVEHCVHSFDLTSGYRTRVRLCRGGWGG
jgi:hypothetical protein